MTAAVMEPGTQTRLAPRKTARRVVLAKVAGFCFGVRRAVDITLKERTQTQGVMVTLGPLVHNSQVTKSLSGNGVGFVSSLDQVESGTVIMSAHGAAPALRREAAARGLNIVDVTCPFVTKVHRSAIQLHETGYQVILVGDPGHTEVLGVVGAVAEIGGVVTVVSSAQDIDTISLAKRVGVVSQTTQYARVFSEVVAAICMRVNDVRAINTVCGATDELQEAAAHMARQVEMAIVVGGTNSANSRRLREICAAQGIPAYQIETVDQIRPEWLQGKEIIGLTAGASTPDSVIEDVARYLYGGELPLDWRLAHPDEK